MPNGWMIYDGMWQTKFKFYPLDKATEARDGYIPAMAVFEIMDESVKQDFGDPNFDWRTAFRGKDEHGFHQHKEPSLAGSSPKKKKDEEPRSTFVEDLLKNELKAVKKKGSTKKPKNKKTQQTATRESRVTEGWSFSTKKPRHGPLAKCQGCEKNIKRDEERLKHKAVLKKNHKHPTIRYFHMNAACVKKAGLQYVEMFQDKKWPQLKVRQIQWDLEEGEEDST